MSCHVNYGPDSVLEVTVWSVWPWTLCDADTCWSSRGYYSENGFYPKIRGCCFPHFFLFFRISFRDSFNPHVFLPPASFLELSLKQLRQSGIDCVAISVSLTSQGGQVEREAGFCQPGAQPPWAHTLAGAFTFLSRHRNKKGEIGRHRPELCFAISQGCLVVCLEIIKLALCFYWSPISLHFQQNS